MSLVEDVTFSNGCKNPMNNVNQNGKCHCQICNLRDSGTCPIEATKSGHFLPQLLDKIFINNVGYGTIVDISNSHGLSYGVVFPNKNGASSRSKTLDIVWHSFDEIQKSIPLTKFEAITT